MKKPSLHEGLRHVSASSVAIAMVMDDGEAVRLSGPEICTMLDEVAQHAPLLLHEALERRLVSLIADEVKRKLSEGG